MNVRVRPAVGVLSAVALVAAPPAHANVTGNVEVQSQTTQNLSEGGSSSPSTFLMESLSLHYAGLPFGPAVAIATAGGAVSNVSNWMGNGVRTDGQVYSFDASVGFLPRRAVPLRLYASGSVDAGGGGALAARGAGPSLLYGATMNVEPGTLVPGMRLDLAESRSSRPGQPDLSDVQRRLVGSSYGTVLGQRLNLGVRAESDERHAAGKVTALGATLNVTSTRHQTNFLASDVRRSFPTLSGISSDRTLSGTSDQRWSTAVSTQLGLRLSEAGAGSATGRLADARASFSWVPLREKHQLTLSGGANAGFTRTSPGEESTSTPSSPPQTVSRSGESYGASARAGYSRPLGAVTGGLGVGTGFNTCDCEFGNEGTTTQVDATVSVAMVPVAKGSAQADYTIARALAPIGRGGDRLENRARASGRLAVGSASHLNASLSYDDGFRELIDITAGRAVTLHEQSITGALGVATRVGRVSLTSELRHTRGSLAGDGVFVAGGARQVRTITSGQAGAAWRPLYNLAVQGQAIGSWTTLADSTSTGSYGANAGIDWRLGRIVFSAQYQLYRFQLLGSPASFQHSIRTVLSRPFEL